MANEVEPGGGAMGKGGLFIGLGMGLRGRPDLGAWMKDHGLTEALLTTLE